MADIIIRRLQPADAAPLKHLVRDVPVLDAADEVTQKMELVVEDQAANEHEEILAADFRNQITGKVTPVKMLHSMRAAEVGGRTVGLSYTGGMAGSIGRIRDISSRAKARLVEAITEIQLLVVHPGYRGRGIGSALAADAEQRAVEFGSTVMHVLTGTDPKGAAAQAWWTRRGYVFGPLGVPWRVQPHVAMDNWDTHIDDFDETRAVGFKALHPCVTVHGPQIATKRALQLRHASLPSIIGALDKDTT